MHLVNLEVGDIGLIFHLVSDFELMMMVMIMIKKSRVLRNVFPSVFLVPPL